MVEQVIPREQQLEDVFPTQVSADLPLWVDDTASAQLAVEYTARLYADLNQVRGFMDLGLGFYPMTDRAHLVIMMEQNPADPALSRAQRAAVGRNRGLVGQMIRKFNNDFRKHPQRVGRFVRPNITFMYGNEYPGYDPDQLYDLVAGKDLLQVDYPVDRQSTFIPKDLK